MANICCDDVIFYTEGNPEGLYDLWEDLETYIILNQNPDLCWIGNLFSHKKIDSTGISLRGNVSYMCQVFLAQILHYLEIPMNYYSLFFARIILFSFINLYVVNKIIYYFMCKFTKIRISLYRLNNTIFRLY